MAWVKIPKENHALFYARLPKDKRIQTLQMFGAAAAKVNGHLFGGLFARSFMVKLSDADHAAALALDGAERFDPMGNGRVMSNSVLMPESLMDEPEEMTSWLQRALDYTTTLPPKKTKASKATSAPSKSAPSKIAQKPARKKPAPSKIAQKNPAQKKPAAMSKPTPKKPATISKAGASKAKPAPRSKASGSSAKAKARR